MEIFAQFQAKEAKYKKPWGEEVGYSFDSKERQLRKGIERWENDWNRVSHLSIRELAA